MSFPPDVREILTELQARTQEALGDQLAGLYLRGSLVFGDFDPETSDVDFLAITEELVSEEQFVRLAAMHEDISRLPNRYAHHLEGAYLGRAAARRFGPGDRRHPEILAGKPLQWSDLRDNWVLERWVVRERGIALAGPPPSTLINRINVDELRSAVRSELERRVEHWAADEAEPPRWLRARFMQAFETETMCRALYTLRFGELCSKLVAVEWAREALPAPWAQLVAGSRLIRADKTDEAGGVEPVKAFVRWSAGEGVGWATQKVGR